MATDAEIIDAFVKNAAEIVRLENSVHVLREQVAELYKQIAELSAENRKMRGMIDEGIGWEDMAEQPPT